MAQQRALPFYLCLLVCMAARAEPVMRTKPAATPTSTERSIAQRWLRSMTLRDKVAQLIVIPTYGEALSSRSKAFKQFVNAVRNLKVGGLIVVNRVVAGSVRSAEPNAMAAFLNRMQRLATVPLLVGGDFERGASMRVAGTPKFPHLMAYGAANDLQLTRALGAATAREARALGVQWVFAPVADVNSNPENPIINIRSFGENAQMVSSHVQAYIEGAQSDKANRVLVTVKHFPGHGDTDVDSHMGLAKLTADRKRLDEIELAPFRQAIAAGVDAVMTAHMAAPALEPEEIPATVSSNVLTGMLRRELRFVGLVVTDAMDMQGLTKQFPGGEAAVRALAAGADVLLMPSNPEAAIQAVVAAVREGRLSRQRIEESVSRVLAAKVRVGLHRNKLVNLEDIGDVIDSPELAEQAQEAADRAVTLVKNEKGAVPLKNPDDSCLYILAESRYGQQGRKLLEEVQRRSRSMRVVLLDPEISKIETSEHSPQLRQCETVVAATFVTAGAYRGNVQLSGDYSALVQSLLTGPAPVVMVSLGSPYLLRGFPQVSSYVATFSPAPTAESAAVKALFGEIAIKGKLPVTIPGAANYGDGILLAARSKQ